MSPEARRYVVALLIDPDRDAVLLIRKRRPAWQAGRLNGPGGKVEPGETVRAAVVRETREETRIDLPATRYDHLCDLVGDGPDVAFHIAFFRAFVPHSDLHTAAAAAPPTDEPLEVHPAGMLPNDVIPNLTWLIPLAAHRHDRYRPFVVEESG